MEPRGALEDVQRLVLGVVDVQRRCAGRRDGDLEDGEPVSRLVAADPDVNELVEELQGSSHSTTL